MAVRTGFMGFMICREHSSESAKIWRHQYDFDGALPLRSALQLVMRRKEMSCGSRRSRPAAGRAAGEGTLSRRSSCPSPGRRARGCANRQAARRAAGCRVRAQTGCAGEPELAIGAVAMETQPEIVLNARVVEDLGVSEEFIQSATARELAAIAQRRERLCGRAAAGGAVGPHSHRGGRRRSRPA